MLTISLGGSASLLDTSRITVHNRGLVEDDDVLRSERRDYAGTRKKGEEDEKRQAHSAQLKCCKHIHLSNKHNGTRMDKRLIGKTAIITGASRGIGRAIAIRLAGEGAQVVLCARDENVMAEAVKEIERTGGRAAAFAVDLREIDGAKRTVQFALDKFGQIDILVNNAGATKRGDFLELTDEDWADGFALKFFGAMRLTRAAWPHLKAQAGTVLNISGVGGRMPGPLFAIGGSVNAAVLSLTKALADVGIRDGVQVNAVNPGSIRTERYRRMLEATAADQSIDVETAERKMIESARTTRVGEPQ